MYNDLITIFPKLDVSVLEETISRFNISNVSEFIAQCAHESAKFSRFKENLNYSAEGLMKTWPKKFTWETAFQCARQPEKIANVVYSSRMGNGNEASGDGWRYIGRGCIQITGRKNYDAVELALMECGICSYFGEVTNNPELLETTPFAYYSAGAYWKNNNLNSITDFKQLTKKINGGLNGYEDREKLLKQVNEILGC